MKVVEGRRLTGPNHLLRSAGAAVEVVYEAGDVHKELSKTWKIRVLNVLNALKWPLQSATRRHAGTAANPLGGATFAFAARIDQLNTAVDIAEWAVNMDGHGSTGKAIAAFRLAAQAEANPELAKLSDFAWELDLPLLWDEQVVSLGFGRSCLCWPVRELPDPSEIDAMRFATIPVALITGTNGKTTTSRLLTHMARCAGHHVGNTSTDGWSIDEKTVEDGDWTGPGAARKVLRDPRVEVAVLETARGGLLRRGLATNLASVAVVTNVSNDHLGEWGIDTVDEMAEAKLAIRRGLRPGGKLVLNAGCAPLVKAADSEHVFSPLHNFAWFARDPENRTLQQALRYGEETATVRDGVITWQCGAHREYVIAVSEVPIAFGGAAAHNVENVLAAVVAARGLGLGWSAIREGLRTFGGNATDNPGRANVIARNGAQFLLDFAHNADGVSHIVQLAKALPAKRRLITLGQAGDRSDAVIAQLAEVAFGLAADRYVLKETEHYLRGRQLGEVTALMQQQLLKLGVREDQISMQLSEAVAVQEAVAWAQPGDLAVVLVHDNFAAALNLVQTAAVVAA